MTKWPGQVPKLILNFDQKVQIICFKKGGHMWPHICGVEGNIQGHVRSIAVMHLR